MEKEANDKNSGLRIKQARLLAGYKSQVAFSQAHPALPNRVSLSSLKLYESGIKKLTHKAAERLASALAEDGVVVSKEWLHDGVGAPPRRIDRSSPQLNTFNTDSAFNLEQFIFNYERDCMNTIDAFLKSHDQGFFCTVADNDLWPELHEGDTVCGVWLPKEAMTLLDARTAVIELNGDKRCRKINVQSDGSALLSTLHSPTKETATLERAGLIMMVLPGVKRVLNY